MTTLTQTKRRDKQGSGKLEHQHEQQPSQQQQQQQQEQQPKLEDLESHLSQLLNKTGRVWTEMAELTLKVQEQQLYKQRGFSSFSAWVREIARKNTCNPSTLWRFVKAAKYFLKISDTTDLNKASQLSAEALEKLEKVERQAPQAVFETLKERVLAGKATVNECRKIEKDYRPSVLETRTNRGRPPKGEEGKIEYLGSWKEADTATDNEVEILADNITSIARNQVAPAIKSALEADNIWMQRCAGMKYPSLLSVTYQEVKVAGVSKRRRFDLVGVARWGKKSRKDLFGVEIKSCLSDFESDTKWEEYLDFCNYFCFAIPLNDEMLLSAIKAATSHVPGIGILGIDFSASLKTLAYPVEVIQYPEHLEGNKTFTIYENLFERALKWVEPEPDTITDADAE